MQVRFAEIHEADLLSDLCFRSKTFWGYDTAFMEACRESLKINSQQIENGYVLVAADGQSLAGVSAMDPIGNSAWELDAFFVDPDFIGKGVGRLLFHAVVDLLTQRNCKELKIVSDPQARPFYEKMGALYERDTQSDVFPDRLLPLLKFTLDSR